MNRTPKILAIIENTIQRERKTADKWLSTLCHREIGTLKNHKAEGVNNGVSRSCRGCYCIQRTFRKG